VRDPRRRHRREHRGQLAGKFGKIEVTVGVDEHRDQRSGNRNQKRRDAGSIAEVQVALLPVT
jgi:hypothetical protein